MRIFLTLLGVALCLLAGCNRAQRESVHPVAGTLIIDDATAANAALAFHPICKEQAKYTRPVAVTGEDGEYRLTTYVSGDGAPAGEYIVTVIWPDDLIPIDECDCVDPIQHDRLQGRYANPQTSQLRALIHPGANDLLLRATAKIPDAAADAGKLEHAQLMPPRDG